jgi:hypothetical protein
MSERKMWGEEKECTSIAFVLLLLSRLLHLLAGSGMKRRIIVFTFLIVNIDSIRVFSVRQSLVRPPALEELAELPQSSRDPQPVRRSLHLKLLDLLCERQDCRGEHDEVVGRGEEGEERSGRENGLLRLSLTTSNISRVMRLELSSSIVEEVAEWLDECSPTVRAVRLDSYLELSDDGGEFRFAVLRRATPSRLVLHRKPGHRAFECGVRRIA